MPAGSSHEVGGRLMNLAMLMNVFLQHGDLFYNGEGRKEKNKV